MCRWLAYSGSPVHLEDLLTNRITRSWCRASTHGSGVETTNGDGFGVGWYGAARTPGMFHSTEPAWNDRNLRELSAHASAGRVFAHIRATTGSAVQQTNCHPFRHGRWLWMHNGVITDFPTVKRDLALAVEPALFPLIEGSTDSELFFFLALTFGLEQDPPAAVARAVGLIEETGRRHGIEYPIQMTVATTDGETTWAFRYSSEGRPGRCSTALISRTLRPSTPTTPCCMSSLTTHAWWCQNRWGPEGRVAGGAGVHLPRRPRWTGDSCTSSPPAPLLKVWWNCRYRGQSEPKQRPGERP